MEKVNLKKHLKEKSAHYTTGILTGFFLKINPLFSIILLVLFLLYEVSEWWVERDSFFKEVREYTAGFIVGYLIYIILKYYFILGG